jgi:hypothetical protein
MKDEIEVVEMIQESLKTDDIQLEEDVDAANLVLVAFVSFHSPISPMLTRGIPLHISTPISAHFVKLDPRIIDSGG